MELASTSAGLFSLSSRQCNGALLITVRGDLDVTTRDQLDDCLTRTTTGYDRIIVELAAVEFMDCASLAVIVAHWKAVTSRGGTLTLTSLRPLPARVLQLTGLTTVLLAGDSADPAPKAMTAARAAPVR